MEKLQQIDVDKLEKVISNIDMIREDIESAIYSKRANKVLLAHYLGKLSMELFENRDKIQEVIDTINDNDLIKLDDEQLEDELLF